MAGGKRKKYDDIHMTPDVSYITNPDVAHEESDVSVGPIAKFVLGLFIFSAVICALMYVMFLFFERRAVESERRPSPLARRGEAALPPNPRLQASKGFGVDLPDGQRRELELREPQAEYRVLVEMWERELKGYEWQDQAAGTVRVPIERAMQLYAQQQQQKRQGQQQPPPGTQPTPAAPVEQTPAASSSGRTGEAKHQ